jgi:Lar family restriction alleviation protein
MNTKGLKPCPLCGGKAERHNYMMAGMIFSSIRCLDCEVGLTRKDRKDPRKEAVAAWNKRVKEKV